MLVLPQPQRLTTTIRRNFVGQLVEGRIVDIKGVVVHSAAVKYMNGAVFRRIAKARNAQKRFLASFVIPTSTPTAAAAATVALVHVHVDPP